MDNNEKIRKRYDRASSLYDILEQPMEIMTLKKWRTEVMKELQGENWCKYKNLKQMEVVL